jgi:hypothetical protein
MNSERDWLVAALRANGIRFLANGGELADESFALEPPALIARLASDPDSRLHLALTALFLLHSDWSAFVPEIVATLDESARIELKARYMAAVYLQRYWQTRLESQLGKFAMLPDLYSCELGLASASERYGKTGLLELADWHAHYSSYPFNRLASYHKSADLLFGQWQAEGRQNELATTR